MTFFDRVGGMVTGFIIFGAILLFGIFDWIRARLRLNAPAPSLPACSQCGKPDLKGKFCPRCGKESVALELTPPQAAQLWSNIDKGKLFAELDLPSRATNIVLPQPPPGMWTTSTTSYETKVTNEAEWVEMENHITASARGAMEKTVRYVARTNSTGPR